MAACCYFNLPLDISDRSTDRVPMFETLELLVGVLAAFGSMNSNPSRAHLRWLDLYRRAGRPKTLPIECCDCLSPTD